MRGMLPSPELLGVVSPETTYMSFEKRLAHTSFGSNVTHRNGEELPRPEPQSPVSLSKGDGQTTSTTVVDHLGANLYSEEEKHRTLEAKRTLLTYCVLGDTALSLDEFEEMHVESVQLGQE